MTNQPPKLLKSRRFSVAQNGDGYEVIDQDGRPVTNAFFTANRPMRIAGQLNDADDKGPTTLSRALGAIEDDDEFVMDDAMVEMLCL